MVKTKKTPSLIRTAGDFYMRHRRAFVMVKIVLLAWVMTFAFSVRNDTGKVVQHNAPSTYAESVCTWTEVNKKITWFHCSDLTAWSPLADPKKECAGFYSKTDSMQCQSNITGDACESAFACSQYVDVTFFIDMLPAINNGSFKLDSLLTIAGTFNGWNPKALQQDTKNINLYWGTLSLSPNTLYTYKYIINGSTRENISERSLTTKVDNMVLPSVFFNDNSCGNGKTERTEICDNGTGNSDTNIGACNMTCSGYVSMSTCTWTVTTNACSKLTFAAQCASSYSLSDGSQCKWDSKNSICDKSSACNPPKTSCGNGIIEAPEVCDDGNTNDGDTCNSKCTEKTTPTCKWTETTNACSKLLVDKECAASYSTSDKYQCKWDGSNNMCVKSSTCTPPVVQNTWLLSTWICTKVTEIASGECVQLVNIYNSTSWSKWTNNSNRWNTKNICRNGGSGSELSGNDLGRYGIYCVDKHVAAIGLKENNLVGYFDADFYQLPNLLMLALPRNPWLTGINPTISGAKALTMLKLSGWRGTFPGEIAYLQNLEYIRVDDVGTSEMWYTPWLFPKLKWISLTNNHLTTVSGAIMSLRPNLEFIDLTYNCIDYTSLSVDLIKYLDTRQANTNSGWKNNQTNCEDIKTKCGDGKAEGKEICDSGPNNGMPWMCNKNCDWYMPKEASCGNNIIEAGELCDDGLNNTKPWQCNKVCNGRTSYNLYCGDGLCRSSCTLDKTITTCKDLNNVTNGKELCTTLWCSLQYVDNSNCNGTVSCSEITPEKFWWSLEGANKYCNIAWCGRDKTKSVCITPATNKAPSCNDIWSTLWIKNTTEYCPRIPGCALSATTQTPATTCVGNMLPRSDKLDTKQCAALNGKWFAEDINSCPKDCDTTCGNMTCDLGEAISCPNDCITKRPEIKYSTTAPLDGGTIKWPVISSVVLPEWCKIINNNGSTWYKFEYNGYYVFQVACPWFDKPWDMIAKVYRLINDTTIILPNVKDMWSATSGANIYFENKNTLVSDVTTNPAMAEAAKRDLMQKAFANATSSGSATSGMDAPVTTTKNISFENDPTVYQKIIFEWTDTKKWSTLTVPADVILQSEINGKKTDFDGVFLAPRDVKWTVLTQAAKTIKNIETIIKAGDENNNKLVAVDGSGNTVEFTLTIETQDPVWSTIKVYASQDWVTWIPYGEATVQTNGEINFVEIIVPHLTYYGVTTNIGNTWTDNGWTSSAWGGGGATINQCTPDRDCKNSYLNTVCGQCTEAAKVARIKAKQASVVCYSYTPELNGAYAFAFANSITTINDCQKANIEWTLLRSHMAKMMSNFAVNTLGIVPNTWAVCNFADMSKESDEMKFYAKLACQLGLMWLAPDGTTVNTTFNPNETVTRAQFGTVLSRLIRGTKNNGGDVYYTKHLQALKDVAIMKNIEDPDQKEIRWYVMLMLQRVTSQVSPTENNNQTLRELVKEFFAGK